MALIDLKLLIPDDQLIAGQSAYEVALSEGFVGTKAEWLFSLNGISGTSSSESVDIMDFGGTLSGDNTPALNAALVSCITAGKRSIKFPSGSFSFASQPNKINGIKLIGSGKTATYLVRDFNGNFLTFAGGTLGGGGAESIGVLAGAGTSGGYGIYLFGDSDEAPDYASFKGLYVSSNGGTFAIPFMIDGQARISPQGVRDIRITDSDFFAGTSAAVWIANGVGIYMDGVGTYPASGTNGDIQITSGSAIVSMSNMNIQGGLNISNAQKITFSGHLVSLNVAASASKCFITGTKGSSSITQSSSSSYANLV